uniref:Uncharacterized protein n=1 Tax=Lygus hesperus TaxID=30085 RepID=A0A0A9XAP0_LYGHE
MGISFSGECIYIRRVCVDNRCPERFYVQNGYWRKTVQECNKLDNSTDGKHNESRNVEEVDEFLFVKDDDQDLGELVFEEPNATELEGLKDAPVTTATYETEVIWQRTAGTNTDSTQNSTNEYQEDNEEDEGEEKGSGERDTENEEDEKTEDPEVERKQHLLGVWTPIGDLKSNPHFILSVSYAVIILILWYLYPVMVFFSFATQLDLNER